MITRKPRSAYRDRVVVVFGTRPEAIKMSPVISELRRRPEVETIVCVTAQHRKMLDQVLGLFSITPDIDLDIMQESQRLDDLTVRILDRFGSCLDELKPDRILVHGDTTTTFASSLAGFYRRIPIGHVEAGLRTGDITIPWPEEMNRRFVDGVADILWAPTDRSAAALRSEGVDPSRVLVTGNTVIDALLQVSGMIDGDRTLKQDLNERLRFLTPNKRMILVTGHRRESLDGGLAEVCSAVDQLAQRPDVEIVWPIHPNPIIQRTLQSRIRPRCNVHLIEPQGYLSFVELMQRCYLIITDSGGIQEEAPTLGKPVLVTRMQTERTEGVLSGSAELVGTSYGTIVAAAERLLDDRGHYRTMCSVVNPFGDGRAAVRIVDSVVERHSHRELEARVS